jgi:hypothetical protein
MPDAVLVIFLLGLIWAAVLLPPAIGARASREAEFLGSIRPGGHPHDSGAPTSEFAIVDQSRFRPALTPNARRRQVLGGLVVAMGATLVLGLIPTFRLLFFVHLMLVNTCLAYVGLLVHSRDQQTARARVAAAPAAWRAERTFDESHFAEPVHPYAYAGGSAGFEYDADYGAEPDYRHEPSYEGQAGSFAEAYGESDESAPGWADESDHAYPSESYAAEDWDDDDEAVAAYVDEELALRTA